MARIGRPTGSRTTPESIVQAVEILSDLGVRAADIHRTLKELIGSRTPPERTVRDIVQRAGRPGEDESGTWSALEAREGVSGRHILAVLRGVAIASDGQIRRITRHEAECVAALADLAPHL